MNESNDEKKSSIRMGSINWNHPKGLYLNANFEPTTPFLSDQKNLTFRLNFVG
jgi:hypothetical protein